MNSDKLLESVTASRKLMKNVSQGIEERDLAYLFKLKIGKNLKKLWSGNSPKKPGKEI
jgi:hypothetical protein